jgi:hypothetical protein
MVTDENMEALDRKISPRYWYFQQKAYAIHKLILWFKKKNYSATSWINEVAGLLAMAAIQISHKNK